MQDSLQRDFSQLAEILSFAQNCISNNEDVCPAPIGLPFFCLERKRFKRFGMFVAGGRTSRPLLWRQVRTVSGCFPIQTPEERHRLERWFSGRAGEETGGDWNAISPCFFSHLCSCSGPPQTPELTAYCLDCSTIR